jgi:Fe-S cluster assembly protein SufD
MTPQELTDRLRQNLSRLPGSAAVQAAREAAMNAFSGAGFPSRKLEDWRYTDLRALSEASFDLLPTRPDDASPDAYARLIATAGLKTGSLWLLFVDGHLIVDRASGGLPRGATLSNLGESWDDLDPAALQMRGDSPPLAALNMAFASQGAWLRLGEGTIVEQPIHLLLIDSDRPSQAPQPRLQIDIGRDARATLVQHYLGTGASSGWTNALTRISMQAGAGLTLTRLQDHGPEHLHTELLEADLAAGAQLDITYIDLGGKLVRNDVQIKLREPEAGCDLAGLFVATGGQHVDNHLRVDHCASSTRSREVFRSIIGEHGRGVFNGKVIVHKQTRGIDARQTSDNLLLSDRGEIDTKPELEIYADDVKCAHGATVGELDEEQLFYLKSRGITDPAARGLLTLAFANEILSRASITGLQRRLTDKLDLELPEDLQWNPAP